MCTLHATSQTCSTHTGGKGMVWLQWWVGKSHPKGFCNNSTDQRFERCYTFVEVVMAVKQNYLEWWKRENGQGSVLQVGLTCSTLALRCAEGSNPPARSDISCSRFQAWDPFPESGTALGCVSTEALVKP